MDPQEFYNKVYRGARDAGANHVQAAIAAAQSSIETGWGKTVKGNSYFGIKAGLSWTGKVINFKTHEYETGGKVSMVDGFRAYDDITDSVKDYLATIKAKWPATYEAKTIAAASIGLKNGVHGAYATAPTYSKDVRVTAQKRAPAAQAAYESPIPTTKVQMNPQSKILPLYRPKQSDAVTLAVLDKFKGLTPADRQGDAVKILIVRGYFLNSMGRKGKNDRAIYDDAVFVVSPEGVQAFNGNSDPSAYKHRVATIKAPQAIRYIPGNHGISRGGGYPAFRQNSDITVLRDGVGEDTDGQGKRFWCNLHRGGVNGTSSLGCLTIPPHQWNEFYKLVAGLLDKHGQKTFYVTLLEYDGNNPPVEVKQPPAVKTPSAAPAVAAVSIIALLASWWDSIISWIGGLFS